MSIVTIMPLAAKLPQNKKAEPFGKGSAFLFVKQRAYNGF
jgi:hypothetical protein